MPDVPSLHEWIVPKLQAENERLRRLHVVNLATMTATVERLKLWGRSHSELDRAIDETKKAITDLPGDERPVVFMCPECFGRGIWPLDPNCSICAGTGVVYRETFDSFLAGQS